MKTRLQQFIASTAKNLFIYTMNLSISGSAAKASNAPCTPQAQRLYRQNRKTSRERRQFSVARGAKEAREVAPMCFIAINSCNPPSRTTKSTHLFFHELELERAQESHRSQVEAQVRRHRPLHQTNVGDVNGTDRSTAARVQIVAPSTGVADRRCDKPNQI